MLAANSFRPDRLALSTVCRAVSDALFFAGRTKYSGQSFEHRRQWVEDRLHELAEIFAVSIWGYAVMSNHLHVVVQVLPEAVASWKAEEIAARWIRLFPRQDQDVEVRTEVLAGNPERIKVLRERLADLSWFMRCLSEPIAKRANREVACKGRFMSMDGRYAGFAGAKAGLGGPVQVPGAAGRDGGAFCDGLCRSQSGTGEAVRLAG